MKKHKKRKLPTILIDSREQNPYSFRASANCAGAEITKLSHGDYQIMNHPELISIERKASIDELSTNLGKHRERFERELEKMQESKHRYVIIESHWSSIYRPQFSKMSPNVIFGSIMALEIKYHVHFIFAGSRKMAHRITRDLLLKAYFYGMK